MDGEGETLSDKRRRGKPMSVEKGNGNAKAREGTLSVRKEKESNPVLEGRQGRAITKRIQKGKGN
jgi:hypothetical protein